MNSRGFLFNPGNRGLEPTTEVSAKKGEQCGAFFRKAGREAGDSLRRRPERADRRSANGGGRESPTIGLRYSINP